MTRPVLAVLTCSRPVLRTGARDLFSLPQFLNWGRTEQVALGLEPMEVDRGLEQVDRLIEVDRRARRARRARRIAGARYTTVRPGPGPTETQPRLDVPSLGRHVERPPSIGGDPC
jgi:hypothetical protein